MGDRFREWLSCPTCDGDGEVSVLAHETDIVLECYDCDRIAEFTIGEDTPLQSLSADTVRSGSDELVSE